MLRKSFFQKIGLQKDFTEEEYLKEFRTFDGIYSKSEEEIKELFKTF